MNEFVNIWEKPVSGKIQMIMGWRQWADAGSISSGLPEYLIKETGARKIGEIKADNFYLFQIPGTHNLLRPVIRLREGYRQSFELNKNEFYYAGDDDQGLVIFLGDEPHINVENYARAFFGAAQEIGVSKIAGVAGVYGSVPYDRDRTISCIYSLPDMKEELAEYAVNFSDYEGGSSIGSYFVHLAEREALPLLIFYGFVPAYDFSQSALNPKGLRLDNDYKAWYDIMRRLNHLLGLGIDLTNLQRKGDELKTAMDEKIAELEQEMPQLNIREYLEGLETQFNELSFWPLDDVWERELRDLFEDNGED